MPLIRSPLRLLRYGLLAAVLLALAAASHAGHWQLGAVWSLLRPRSDVR